MPYPWSRVCTRRTSTVPSWHVNASGIIEEWPFGLNCLTWFRLKFVWCCQGPLVSKPGVGLPWWRHQIQTFSALLALCAGNSPVHGEFPSQRPVTRSFDVFFDLRRNIRLSKKPWGWWCETPSRSLWRHCNAKATFVNFSVSNIFDARKVHVISFSITFILTGVTTAQQLDTNRSLISA